MDGFSTLQDFGRFLCFLLISQQDDDAPDECCHDTFDFDTKDH